MHRIQRITLAIVSLVLLTLASCATQHAASSHADQWIGTWGASPVVSAANAPSYNNQTLRLIVHSSIGGDEIRVRFVNTFGTKPLLIGGAAVALQDSGAAISASSNKPLTFNGRTSVSIPPNALIVSDPVQFSLPAQRNLAVSIFLSSDAGLVTAHPLATQNSYVSTSGNFVDAAEATAFTTTIQTWPFLAGIDVRANTPTHAIVTFGDSITDGYKSTVDANHRWPDYFFARLHAAGHDVGVINEGISGNRLLHDSAGGRPVFGPNALSRFDRDALVVSGVSHIIVLLGINDIGMGSPARNPDEVVSADDVIGALHQLTVRAHSRGLRIVGATLTPFTQAAYATEAGEAKRQAVNAWIRSTEDFDGFIDFDRATRDPRNPAQFLQAYDSGDHLHPNDAGYKAMADSVDLSLFK